MSCKPCKHLVHTPYGQACDLHKTFIRTGDMIRCGGCQEAEPWPEPKPEKEYFLIHEGGQ